MLTLELSDPVGTVVESHQWTTLTIADSDDQAVVSLASDDPIQLSEDVGGASIKVMVHDWNWINSAKHDYQEM